MRVGAELVYMPKMVHDPVSNNAALRTTGGPEKPKCEYFVRSVGVGRGWLPRYDTVG